MKGDNDAALVATEYRHTDYSSNLHMWKSIHVNHSWSMIGDCTDHTAFLLVWPSKNELLRLAEKPEDKDAMS